jgi:hypothetical protein
MLPGPPNRLRSAFGVAVAFGVALALVAPPAGASHGGIHPTVRMERVYFHCNGPTKVGNLNLVTNGPVSWNTSPPAGSVSDGEGCGNLDPGAARGSNQATVYDAQFRGVFTGNLESLTVEVHNLLLNQIDLDGSYRIRVWLTIDGETIVPDTTFVDVAPEASATGASHKFLFSVPDLGCSREVLDEEGNVVDVVTDGLVRQDGDGTLEHDVLLTLDSWFTDRASAWVYDTTEVPSGITFNPDAELAPAKANPTDPANCG